MHNLIKAQNQAHRTSYFKIATTSGLNLSQQHEFFYVNDPTRQTLIWDIPLGYDFVRVKNALEA